MLVCLFSHSDYAIRPAVIFNICLLFFIYSPFTIHAQDPVRNETAELLSALNASTADRAVENLYLHTDRSFYSSEDTLWFKAYLLDAALLIPSRKSGLLYVELVTDSNIVIKRTMLPVAGGIAFGQVVLSQKDVPPGGYYIRAYTNWMRNFDERTVFKKHIFVNKAADKEWLISYDARRTREAGAERIRMGLKFNRFDGIAVGAREMQIRLTDGKRNWLKNNVQTGVDGLLDINFELPQKADLQKLAIDIMDMRKGEGNRRLQVPVLLGRTEYTDIQFMPEGGTLIANLPSRVAFKALSEDGLATDVEGSIYDSKLQEVVRFKSGHKGMGYLNLVPQPGETYSARILLADGSYKTYSLPAVENEGVTLKVNNRFDSDSCEVIVRSTPGLFPADRTCFLIGQVRGLACYGAAFKFRDGSAKIKIGKDILPNGIAQFTLLGPDKNVLCERLIFIDHNERLRIKVSSNKTEYYQRDSISLDIEVTDKNGTPVQASFSMAVTDDGQIRTDSLKEETLPGRMLLSGALKGHIEDPGYYVDAAADAQKWQHLDQLLMTQGWTKYEWNAVSKNGGILPYEAEEEFLVKGKVTNMFNKPVAGSGVGLLSKKPLIVSETTTNEQGLFSFKGIVPADTAVFFIQSKNKKGKSFNVGIEINEFQPPVFAAAGYRTAPWFINMDTLLLSSVKRQIALKSVQQKVTGGNVLNEVTVTAKKIVRDSKNLNGPGEANVIIGSEDLEQRGEMTLGDLLEKKVPGFYVRFTKSGGQEYRIRDMTAHLIIDGVDTEFFKSEEEPLYLYLKKYFDYYTAADIKGIEVMFSTRYSGRYFSTFIHDPNAKITDNAFIEVTTYGGKGPFLKKTPGTYVYRPMPFTMPKQFYSPRYTPGSIADMTDIRTTLYWAPNIITNKEGRARVSFYTSDNPGTYSLVMEGCDMNGSVGLKRERVIVKRNGLLNGL